LHQEKVSITADAVKEDTQAAVDTLQDLQAQFAAVSMEDIESKATSTEVYVNR
jgi:hypothetical protein